ncbi:hypothetical protein GWI33_001736 [Rhynchophorus ferrugineus]|uniref:Uncharacterized protein n=1 Tax=Rhynchophorus ferrugineus TaxID=354439 RepID=A0A834IZU0_RHYFE|nr:hypothetical protein GWI33_001736 [Rhynchophorus ferrugineus]
MYSSEVQKDEFLLEEIHQKRPSNAHLAVLYYTFVIIPSESFPVICHKCEIDNSTSHYITEQHLKSRMITDGTTIPSINKTPAWFAGRRTRYTHLPLRQKRVPLERFDVVFFTTKESHRFRVLPFRSFFSHFLSGHR